MNEIPVIPEASDMWNLTHEEIETLIKAWKIRIRESKMLESDPMSTLQLQYYYILMLKKSEKFEPKRDIISTIIKYLRR
jgi:hypothetical protein